MLWILGLGYEFLLEILWECWSCERLCIPACEYDFKIYFMFLNVGFLSILVVILLLFLTWRKFFLFLVWLFILLNELFLRVSMFYFGVVLTSYHFGFLFVVLWNFHFIYLTIWLILLWFLFLWVCLNIKLMLDGISHDVMGSLLS